MKYIIQKRPGKVNVREHERHLDSGNTDVVRHTRSHPTSRRGVRETIGIIPLKDYTYSQARIRYPFIEPRGDIDEDGVPNKRDCRPFDVDRQDNKDWGKSLTQQDDLDSSIKPILEDLNDAGYKTLYSCSGLEEEHTIPVKKEPYIVFKTKNGKQYRMIKEAAKENKLHAVNALHEDDTGGNITDAVDRIIFKLTGKAIKKKEHPLGADLSVRGDKKDSDSEKMKKLTNFRNDLINKKELELKKTKPYIDSDGDGVINKFDCHPADPTRQHVPGNNPVAGFKINREIPAHSLREDKVYEKDLSSEPYKKIVGEKEIEKPVRRKSSSSLSPWVLAQMIEAQKMKSKAYDYLDEEEEE